MAVFYFLDLISTFTEGFCLWLFMGCFLKQPCIQPWLARLVVPVSIVAFAFFCTWWTVLGAYKIFFISALAILGICLFYRDGLVPALVVYEIWVLTVSIVPEAVMLGMGPAIFGDAMLVQVAGETILRPAVYLLTLSVRFVFVAGVWLLVRHFRYPLNGRDGAILTAIFLVPFSLFWATSYQYLNLSILSEGIFYLSTIIFAIFFFLIFLYARNLQYLRAQAEQDRLRIAQLEQQYAYHLEKQKTEERVRAIYHDMKNHLLLLEVAPQSPEMKASAQALRAQIADYEDFVHSGNDFLDVILRAKAERACEQKIAFSVMISHFDKAGFISPLDLSTIFGNALDNAIEASEQLPPEERLISLKVGVQQGLLAIGVENNMRAASQPTRTSKDDAFLHGFGLTNIRQAVERYGGAMNACAEGGKFHLEIAIPLS